MGAAKLNPSLAGFIHHGGLVDLKSVPAIFFALYRASSAI